MIVVDASVILEILLRTRRGISASERVLEDSLHAPHLLDLEVSQVLRRYVFSGDLDAQRAGEALDDLLDFPITRYPHAFLLPRIWELRRNLTAYDAAYVVLAESLPATLATCDRRLTAGAGANVSVLLF